MKKIEEVIKTIEVTYVAKDGSRFDYEKDCQDYEFFLDHVNEILENIIFFSKDNLERISPLELGYYGYGYLKDDKYAYYHKFFEKYAKKHEEFSNLRELDYITDTETFYVLSYDERWGYSRWGFLGNLENLEILNKLADCIKKEV